MILLAVASDYSINADLFYRPEIKLRQNFDANALINNKDLPSIGRSLIDTDPDF
jgi:hypothetical protein